MNPLDRLMGLIRGNKALCFCFVGFFSIAAMPFVLAKIKGGAAARADIPHNRPATVFLDTRNTQSEAPPSVSTEIEIVETEIPRLRLRDIVATSEIPTEAQSLQMEKQINTDVRKRLRNMSKAINAGLAMTASGMQAAADVDTLNKLVEARDKLQETFLDPNVDLLRLGAVLSQTPDVSSQESQGSQQGEISSSQVSSSASTSSTTLSAIPPIAPTGESSSDLSAGKLYIDDTDPPKEEKR